MFVDVAKITVKAGNGGNGAVAFHREKYVPAGGPSGGNGGRGGNVVFLVDNNMRTLLDFKYKSKYEADNGEDGKTSNMFGKNAEDLIIKVPEGTVVRDAKTKLVIADLNENGQQFIIAHGGRGGKGNSNFKTSTRQAPAFAKKGMKGEEIEVELELKLLADVGLIGFPNVGKSTFLSIVTKANPKIANYHFTTLIPNLGVASIDGDSFVIADIPGLIEGASEGVGLGDDFLRHIQRTKVLVHIVDISSSDGRNPLEDFEIINKELATYDKRLESKKQIVVANKMDLLYDKQVYEEFKAKLNEKGYEVFSMSAATTDGVNDILRVCKKYLDNIVDVELFDQDQYYSAEKDAQENIDEITVRKEDDVFYLEGYQLERLLYSVNFEDLESIRYFQNKLDKIGVTELLKNNGIKEGDTVDIYGMEFEYYN